MKTQRKLLYVMLGGVLALSLVFGAFAVFAQTEGEADSDAAVPEAESEDNDEGVVPARPRFPWPRRGGSDGERPDFFGRGMPDRFGGERPELTGGDELLAEALGISVEELQEAREEARMAVIDQAEAEGLLTEEQAEQLRSAPPQFLRRFGRGGAGIFDDTDGHESFLADALGISEEALQSAREEAKDARLAEMVESGVITQEQLDKLQANQAVRQYLDLDGLRESIQAAYEAAVEQALAEGAITQAQADEMLENASGFGLPRFGGRGPGGPGMGGPGMGRPGMGGRGFGGHGFGHQGGFAPFQQGPASTAPDNPNA